MVAYFLQVNVCWLLFYGVYYALLSKETFFRLNRIWLITSLLCGLALPFAADYFAVKVTPTIVFAMTLEPFVVTAKALQQNMAADTEGVVLKIVAAIYVLGSAVLSARFLGGLFIIFKILKKAKIEEHAGFRLVFTEGGVPPFSFFNFIFINPNEFESYDFQQIMQHEKAHVRQRHSFDVVFLEILNIVFWCSPLIYFYKTSLRNVHEYLADEAVLRKNATPQYGRLLLKQRQSRIALSLTSNISNHFFSQLKKRILMMTRNKSKRTALIKYALAAPIFLILTAALASPETPLLAKTEVLSDKVVAAVEDFEKIKLDNFQKEVSLSNDNLIVEAMMAGSDELPIIMLPSKKTGGMIRRSEFLACQGIMARKKDNAKYHWRVLNFKVTYYPANAPNRIITILNNSAFFSEEVQKLMTSTQDGDVYIFSEIKANREDGQNLLDFGSMSFIIGNSPPQYSSSRIDTIFKPLSELKLVDEKQIQQMNIESKEEFNTRITVTFKDGHIEYFKGSKADMEKAFRPFETATQTDAAKLEAERKTMVQYKQKLDDEQKAAGQQSQKLDEMVVVGRGTPNSATNKQAQKLEDEKKAFKLRLDKQQAEKNGDEPVFTVVEQNPEFVGGMSALFRWLGENIKYPKSARDAGAQGTVYVGFVVEKDGSITNVSVKRDVPVIIRDTITITEVNGIKGNKIVERTEYSLGKEAVRVVSMMPNWKSGKHNGSPVRVAYTLPLKFKLE